MKHLLAIVCTSASLGLFAMQASAQVPESIFHLQPQPKFAACLGVPGQPAPTAQMILQRGELNDVLIVHAAHLKPHLKFDLFTTQNTNLLANGTVDPHFQNFGLAWYQTDLEADASGNAEVTIKTILLEQIFGFDPATNLPPTHTFHVGFWFNNPADAAPCGFNGAPTPFNGEQNAGPNAMMSTPHAITNLGPLCTAVKKEGSVFVCNE